MAHDLPGQGYGAEQPPTTPPETHVEKVDADRGTEEAVDATISSRSTQEEARDLIALKRAKRGDTAAFAGLVRDNDASIRAFVTALIGPEPMDQVTLDAYVKAYRGLPLAPATSPRIWLFGIADGACRDAIRRRNRPSHRTGRIDDPPIPLGLSQDQRLAVALVDAAGLTAREATRLTQLDVAATRDLLTEARGQLDPAIALSEAPDHSASFWNDLGRALLVARATPASPRAGSTPRPGIETRDSSRAPVPGPTVQSGRAAKGVARHTRRQSGGQFPWRTASVFGLIGLVVLSVMLVSLVVARRASHRDAGLGLTTNKVLDQLDQALSRDSQISGTAIVTKSSDHVLPKGRYTFVRTSTGAYLVQAADGSAKEAYNQAESAYTRMHHAQTNVAVTKLTGIAPGPPELTAVAPDSIGDLLSDSVRLIHYGVGQTSESTSVTQPSTGSPGSPGSTVPGVPVWVLTARFPTSSPLAPGNGQLPGVGRLTSIPSDEIRLVVNQSFALPQRIELLRRGQVIFDLRFTDLSIGQDSDFASLAGISIPPGADVTHGASGFTQVGIGDVESALGREIPTPSFLPDGFVLTTVAIDQNRDIVAYAYRHGSLQITLTNRPASGGPAADPFGKQASGSPPKKVTMDSGALSGSQAWFANLPIAHLWVAHKGFVTVIAGDGSASDFTKIASSLQ